MMNENEDLISRLRAMGRRPVDSGVAAGHLAAMADPAGTGAPPPGRHRLKIVAAFAVGLLAGTSGLATAGALPNGAQEVAHRTLGAVGVKVPHGDRYQGPECGGEFKNHGQYVKAQPKETRVEAAKSRCGKPIQAGTGDPGGASDGKAGGCQGPPPWAGKGKPDPAAKAARQQACGDDDKDEGKAPAVPDAGVRKVAPEEPATVTTEPPTSDTTAPATATTTEPTATTTTTPTTTTTTTTDGGGEETTSTTAGSDGATTTTALIPGSGLGS